MPSIEEIVLLSVVQGITEWLPVSSSGHLVLTQYFMNIAVSVEFDLILHLGTLLSVLVYFRKRIVGIIKDFVSFDFEKKNAKLGLHLILATIPIAIAGFLFQDFFEALFSDVRAVAVALVVNGIVLTLTMFAKPGKKIGLWNTFLIGIAQAVAIVPGISRSGITISAGMFLGLKKDEAAEFSFLLSIPALIGAAVLKFQDLVFGFGELLGLVLSFVIGYVAIAFLLNVIKRGAFWLFGVYTMLLGVYVLLI